VFSFPLGRSALKLNQKLLVGENVKHSFKKIQVKYLRMLQNGQTLDLVAHCNAYLECWNMGYPA